MAGFMAGLRMAVRETMLLSNIFGVFVILIAIWLFSFQPQNWLFAGIVALVGFAMMASTYFVQASQELHLALGALGPYPALKHLVQILGSSASRASIEGSMDELSLKRQLYKMGTGCFSEVDQKEGKNLNWHCQAVYSDRRTLRALLTKCAEEFEGLRRSSNPDFICAGSLGAYLFALQMQSEIPVIPYLWFGLMPQKDVKGKRLIFFDATINQGANFKHVRRVVKQAEAEIVGAWLIVNNDTAQATRPLEELLPSDKIKWVYKLSDLRNAVPIGERSDILLIYQAA